MGISVEWWGSSAFRIRFNDTCILLDPYISRNFYADPIPPLTLAQLADNADQILLSHGHFDHIADVPALLRQNPIVRVHGPEMALQTIRREGGQGTDLNQGRVKISDDVNAEVFLSKHLRPDFRSIAKTVLRTMVSKASLSCLRPALLRKYPGGESLSYVITFKTTDASPFRIQFLGSAGPTDEMLQSWARVHRRMDCLLLPLQGHSKINEIGARIVEILKPRFVIPHHHDDYYPPLSQKSDLSALKRLIAEKTPDTVLLELDAGTSHTFDLQTKKAAPDESDAALSELR